MTTKDLIVLSCLGVALFIFILDAERKAYDSYGETIRTPTSHELQ